MENVIQAYTVRANRQKPRIWIEGARLNGAGFTHGARYNVMATGNILALVLSDDGSRKVAGAANRPIIDMSGRSCQPFTTGDDVTITYQQGIITIERAQA